MRLPPLIYLRAFEVAARQLSFTRAATELHLTQSAVSYQIKALEDALGVKVFHRQTRKLTLTAEGEILAQGVRTGLECIVRALDTLEKRTVTGPLTVNVLSSFAARWLIPRLGDWRREHPDIEIRLAADDRLVDFSDSDIDVAIRFGLGRYPGLETVRIMGDTIMPVCSPRLLQQGPPLNSPADLDRHVLLHDAMAEHDGSGADWKSWIQKAGISGIDSEKGPRFSPAHMLIQAAIEGQGVALGRASLVADDLTSGRLVKPFGPIVGMEFAYYLVCRPEAASHPKLIAFQNWLLKQASL